MALIGESLPEFGQEGAVDWDRRLARRLAPEDCRADSIYTRAWSGPGGEVETSRSIDTDTPRRRGSG